MRQGALTFAHLENQSVFEFRFMLMMLFYLLSRFDYALLTPHNATYLSLTFAWLCTAMQQAKANVRSGIKHHCNKLLQLATRT